MLTLALSAVLCICGSAATPANLARTGARTLKDRFPTPDITSKLRNEGSQESCCLPVSLDLQNEIKSEFVVYSKRPEPLGDDDVSLENREIPTGNTKLQEPTRKSTIGDLREIGRLIPLCVIPSLTSLFYSSYLTPQIDSAAFWKKILRSYMPLLRSCRL